MDWTGLSNVPAGLDDGDNVDDADADASNELQDLELSGNTLSLSSDVTTVDLSGYLDNTDEQTLAAVLAQSNDAASTPILNIGAAGTDFSASGGLILADTLTLSSLDCTANANGGALTADASGVVSCSDDENVRNTLDAAYDQGGAGAGRTITADSGAVTITGTDGLELNTGNLLQTPGNPEITGNLSVGQTVNDVFVSGRYAYVVDSIFG